MKKKEKGKIKKDFQRKETNREKREIILDEKTRKIKERRERREKVERGKEKRKRE